MIDLFYPAGPMAYRHGRLVTLLTPPQEAPQRTRRKGKDPAKAKARQARYRARMRADAVRHARHIQACRDWYAEHRNEEIARMRERRAARLDGK